MYGDQRKYSTYTRMWGAVHRRRFGPLRSIKRRGQFDAREEFLIACSSVPVALQSGSDRNTA